MIKKLLNASWFRAHVSSKNYELLFERKIALEVIAFELLDFDLVRDGGSRYITGSLFILWAISAFDFNQPLNYPATSASLGNSVTQIPSGWSLIFVEARATELAKRAAAWLVDHGSLECRHVFSKN